MHQAAWAVALPLLFALILLGCSEPPTKLLDGVTSRVAGHNELSLSDAAPPIPRFVGEIDTAEICLQAPPLTDTTRWEAAVWFQDQDRPQQFTPPSRRLGRSICYAATLPRLSVARRSELCAEWIDRYDGKRSERRCHPTEIGGDGQRYDAALTRFRETIALRSTTELERWFELLDETAAEARASQFPVLAHRIRLAQVYFTRRGERPDAAAMAMALLEESPGWLDADAASEWSAMHAYERATLFMESDHKLAEAWGELRDAESRYRATANPTLLTVAMKQAEILARTGSIAEGRRRITAALRRCGEDGCDARFVGAAENTLAWLTMQDRSATTAEISEVERRLLSNVEQPEDDVDPIERANGWVNLAYLQLLKGDGPSEALAQAQTIIDALSDTEAGRIGWLRHWSSVIQAQYALQLDDRESARRHCEQITREADRARLLAWGHSCLAQLQLREGDLLAAKREIGTSLRFHAYADNTQMKQDIPAGPGQRSADAYTAVRISIELGEAEAAWSRLERLDRWRDPSLAEAESLLELARELDQPASRALREQRAEIKQTILDRAQEALRTTDGDNDETAAGLDRDVEFRAVQIDGVIHLLRRRDGVVSIYRQSPMSEVAFAEAIEAIDLAVQRGETKGVAWHLLVSDLAAALVPDASDLDSLKPVTVYSLHGALQRVPLALLPVDSTPTAAPLIQQTVVAHQPAGTLATVESMPSAVNPLFVVDPRRDLSTGTSSADNYRDLFSDATILTGAEASTSAVRGALESADWLHIDAHGSYDAAFPELSQLFLADAPISASWIQRSRPSLELANLSACGAGRWPVTAGGGRFGMAGLLATQGSSWVISSRADLDDRLAREFNRLFYLELSRSRSIPEAFQLALLEARNSFDAAKLSALVLLKGPERKIIGQTSSARTLEGVKVARSALQPQSEISR